MPPSIPSSTSFYFLSPPGSGDEPNGLIHDFHKARQAHPGLTFDEFSKNPSAYQSKPLSPASSASSSSLHQTIPELVIKNERGDPAPLNYRQEFRRQYRSINKSIAEGVAISEADLQGFMENAARILAEKVVPLVEMQVGASTSESVMVSNSSGGVFNIRPSLSAEQAYDFLQSGRFSFLTDSARLLPNLANLEAEALQELINVAEPSIDLAHDAKTQKFQNTVKPLISKKQDYQQRLSTARAAAEKQARGLARPKATPSLGIWDRAANILKKFGFRK